MKTWTELIGKVVAAVGDAVVLAVHLWEAIGLGAACSKAGSTRRRKRSASFTSARIAKRSLPEPR